MAERKSARQEKQPRKKRVTFVFNAPGARSVRVTGTFCGWHPQSHALKKDRRGGWRTSIWLVPGRYEYRFLVDGQWRDDPSCRERVANSYGSENCVLNVALEKA